MKSSNISFKGRPFTATPRPQSGLFYRLNNLQTSVWGVINALAPQQYTLKKNPLARTASALKNAYKLLWSSPAPHKNQETGKRDTTPQRYRAALTVDNKLQRGLGAKSRPSSEHQRSVSNKKGQTATGKTPINSRYDMPPITGEATSKTFDATTHPYATITASKHSVLDHNTQLADNSSSPAHMARQSKPATNTVTGNKRLGPGQSPLNVSQTKSDGIPDISMPPHAKTSRAVVHKVSADGACQFRAALALKYADKKWLSSQSTTLTDIINELESSRTEGRSTESHKDGIIRNIKNSLAHTVAAYQGSVNLRVKSVLALLAKEGCAKKLYRQCITPTRFNLYSPQGVLHALTNQTSPTLQKDIMNASFTGDLQDVIATLTDSIGNAIALTLDMPLAYSEERRGYAKLNQATAHYDVVAPANFFNNTSSQQENGKSAADGNGTGLSGPFPSQPVSTPEKEPDQKKLWAKQPPQPSCSPATKPTGFFLPSKNRSSTPSAKKWKTVEIPKPVRLSFGANSLQYAQLRSRNWREMTHFDVSNVNSAGKA